MELGPKGFEIIKHFEGCRLKSYPDPATKAEPYTIGWGSTRYGDGTKVELGQTITQEQADDLFKNTLQLYVDCVNNNIKVEISQEKFDSMVSLCYNTGCGNFGRSSVMKKCNVNPNDPTIRDSFLLWNKAAGKIIKGLVTRRNAEADLYFSK